MCYNQVHFIRGSLSAGSRGRRPIQGASHGRTGCPELTSEARLTTLTWRVTVSGRLSPSIDGKPQKAAKWTHFATLAERGRSPWGGSCGVGCSLELPTMTPEVWALLRSRCAQVHRHRSWSKNKVLMRAVAIRECCPPTLPSHPARSFTASLRLPLLRYGIRRLYTLLWLHGRRNQPPPFGLPRCGLYDGLWSSFGQFQVVWCSLLELLRLRSLLYIIWDRTVVRD